MKKINICFLSLIFPFILVQCWTSDDDKFPLLIMLFIVSFFAYLIIFVIGVLQKKKDLILGLIFYVLGMILTITVINFQTKLNENNATVVIHALENFNKDNGHYPDSLHTLIPKHLKSLPKVWFGIIYKNYIYFNDKKNNGYAFYIQTGTKPYKLWTSGIKEWQFLD